MAFTSSKSGKCCARMSPSKREFSNIARYAGWLGPIGAPGTSRRRSKYSILASASAATGATSQSILNSVRFQPACSSSVKSFNPEGFSA